MAYERDETIDLFVTERCPHCGARLYLSHEDEAKGRRPICLNACTLRVWQNRIMQQGLNEARTRVEQADVAAREAGRVAREERHEHDD